MLLSRTITSVPIQPLGLIGSGRGCGPHGLPPCCCPRPVGLAALIFTVTSDCLFTVLLYAAGPRHPRTASPCRRSSPPRPWGSRRTSRAARVYSTPAARAPASARFWSVRLCVYHVPTSRTSAASRRNAGDDQRGEREDPATFVPRTAVTCTLRNGEPQVGSGGRRAVREPLDAHRRLAANRDRADLEDRHERERLRDRTSTVPDGRAVGGPRRGSGCRPSRPELDGAAVVARVGLSAVFGSPSSPGPGCGRPPPSAPSRWRGGSPRSSRRRRVRSRAARRRSARNTGRTSANSVIATPSSRLRPITRLTSTPPAGTPR